MLHQLHWQFKDGTTEMRMQRDVSSIGELSKLAQEGWVSHPPPEGAIFMMCNEKSKHFIMAKDGILP